MLYGLHTSIINGVDMRKKKEPRLNIYSCSTSSLGYYYVVADSPSKAEGILLDTSELTSNDIIEMKLVNYSTPLLVQDFTEIKDNRVKELHMDLWRNNELLNAKNAKLTLAVMLLSIVLLSIIVTFTFSVV